MADKSKYFVSYQVERRGNPIPVIMNDEVELDQPISGFEQVLALESQIKQSLFRDDVTKVTLINFRGFDK